MTTMSTLRHLPGKVMSLISELPGTVTIKIEHIDRVLRHMSWDSMLAQVYVVMDFLKSLDYETCLQMMTSLNRSAIIYMPTIRYALFEIFEGIFAPKQVLKQLTLALILQFGVSGVQDSRHCICQARALNLPH